MWTEISTYILHPKFKEVCCNIAKRSGLHDDLYQELILTLLEKIENKNEPFLRAWEGKYIDWYILTTAKQISLTNYTKSMRMPFVSHSTGDTDVQYNEFHLDNSQQIKETEIVKDSMVEFCESRLEKQGDYKKTLFTLYVFGNISIRELERKTGIPRNTIHQKVVQVRKSLCAQLLYTPSFIDTVIATTTGRATDVIPRLKHITGLTAQEVVSDYIIETKGLEFMRQLIIKDLNLGMSERDIVRITGISRGGLFRLKNGVCKKYCAKVGPLTNLIENEKSKRAVH